MNREIDEQVARKLGWKEYKCSYCPKEHLGSPDGIEIIPRYSTSIKAAWEMVEKIPHFTLYHADIYSAKWKVSWLGLEGVEYAGSDTAPMTICKAFLALK